MSLYNYMHSGSGAFGGHKKAWDFVELELQMFLSHLIWVLGAKLRYYVRKSIAHLVAEPSLQLQSIFLSTNIFL